MQERPDITAKNIAELFSERDGTFRVPDYQRQYAWTDEEIEDLFSDLYDFHTELKAGGNGSYILGQAIFAPNTAQDSSIFSNSIVDGQQRLTSLYLLAIVLRRWLGYFGVVGAGDDPVDKAYRALGSVLRYHDTATGNENVRLSVAYRGDAYIENLLQDAALPEVTINDTQANIKQNSQILDEKIRLAFKDDKVELASFVNTVLYKVWIIVTKIDSEAQALEIFDKINSRGKPLNSAELMKTLLFRQASEEQYKEISDSWNSAAEHVFRFHPRRTASMQYLMKSLLGVRQGSGTSNRKVFDQWTEVLEKSEEDMVTFAADLNLSAKFLGSVANQSKTVANKHLHASRYHRTVQQLPVLLAGRDIYKNTETYERLCRFVDARILLSLMAKEQSQTFERLVWPWAKEISALGADSSESDLLRACLSSIKDIKQLKQQAKLAMTSLDYRVARDNKMIRFLLAVASWQTENDAQDAGLGFEIEELLVKNNYDMDHIFPKSLVESADFDLSQGKDWVHSIGNLTLLHKSDNRRLGAANAGEKSEAYGEARLLLTKSLATDAHLPSNPRHRSVVATIHANEGQQVSKDWHFNQVEKQCEAYWNILERYIDGQLGLVD